MKRPVLIPTLILALTLITTPVLAVQPDEILSDPALEARARELSKNLRCLVCRNENIDDSDADLARDLRILVRERLTDGDTDEQALAFIVDRYGEYVLLTPNTKGANLILWIAGPLMLLTGAGLSAAYIRRRRQTPEPAALSAEEEARLRDILTK
jgi:cytochrome c-type biogenesis protein CcmH